MPCSQWFILFLQAMKYPMLWHACIRQLIISLSTVVWLNLLLFANGVDCCLSDCHCLKQTRGTDDIEYVYYSLLYCVAIWLDHVCSLCEHRVIEYKQGCSGISFSCLKLSQHSALCLQCPCKGRRYLTHPSYKYIEYRTAQAGVTQIYIQYHKLQFYWSISAL